MKLLCCVLTTIVCLQGYGQNAYQQQEICTRAVYDWYEQSKKGVLDKYTVEIPPPDNGKALKACNHPWSNRVCRAHRRYCSCAPCENAISQANDNLDKEKDRRLAQCTSAYKVAAAREEQQEQERVAREEQQEREKQAREQQQAKEKQVREAKAAAQKQAAVSGSSAGRTSSTQRTGTSGYTSTYYAPTQAQVALQQTQNYINQSNQQREQMTQTITDGIQGIGNILLQAQERKQREREEREARLEEYREGQRQAEAKRRQRVEEDAGKGYIKDIVAFADIKAEGGYDLTTAHQMYLQTAELGNAQAMYGLYLDYLKGRGTSKSDSLATYWVKQAAKYGNTAAMRAIGTDKWTDFADVLDQKWNGYGMEKDRDRSYAIRYQEKGTLAGLQMAIVWWKRYAARGKSEGNRWSKKIGLSNVKNIEKRIKARQFKPEEPVKDTAGYWFNKAMEQYNNNGQKADSAVIADFRKAADMGDEEALIMLARLSYEKLPHTPENNWLLLDTYLKADHDRKAYMYRMAADMLASRAVECFRKGEDDLALKYLTKAAEMKNLTALMQLTRVYETGIFSVYGNGENGKAVQAKDDAMAKKWSMQWQEAIEEEKMPEFRIDHAVNHIAFNVTSAAMALQIEELKEKHKIVSAILGGPDEYAFVYGSNGYATNKLTPGLLKALSEIYKGKPTINQIVQTHKTGAYLVIYDNYGYSSNGLAPELLKELKRCNSAGLKISNVAIAPNGGWIVINGSNGNAYKGIPEKLAAKVEELNKNASVINYITFTSKGGWVIIYDDYGYMFEGIPEAAAEQLGLFNKKKTRISFICFDDQDHYVIN